MAVACGNSAGVAQSPTDELLERDERAIARWKRKRWPEIKKKPKNQGFVIRLRRRKAD